MVVVTKQPKAVTASNDRKLAISNTSKQSAIYTEHTGPYPLEIMEFVVDAALRTDHAFASFLPRLTPLHSTSPPSISSLASDPTPPAFRK